MAADLKLAENFLNEIDTLLKTIDDARNEELIDASHCLDVQQLKDDVRKTIELSKSIDRTLNIGIVGDVKAGKSSFINACIFDGKNILPTNITPTTATLTKITYSKTPSTVIHYCSQEDWARIEDGANSYDLSLQSAYDKYVQMSKNNKNKNERSGLPFFENQPQLKTKEEFAASASWKDYSEIEKACREIVDMVQNTNNVDLLSMLGKTEIIDSSDLNDYVGATGTFTPIVNYVEMQTDNESLDGLMIVDTPGLEDPVESRGRKTKEFLAECDVVILLSRCSQFMGDSTVRMIDQLPSAGVGHIIVAGSKFDLGVLDDRNKNFADAVRATQSSNRKQFHSNLQALMNQHADDVIRLRALKQISKTEPLFTSPILYTASQKLKNGSSLNDSEQHVITKLGKFNGFQPDAKMLQSLSGIGSVRKRFNEVIEDKERILSEKGKDLVHTASIRLRKLLDDMIVDSKRRMNDIKNGEEKEYKLKYERLCSIIDSTRQKLRHIFEIAADDCQKNEMLIESYIKMEINNHTAFKVNTNTETYSYTSGHFFWEKDHTRTTTTQTVSTAVVINNINSYYASCQALVSEQFRTLVDKETISAKVKETVLDAYNNGSFDFSEDDILIPLESMLSRIEIPPYIVNPNRFIDRARSKFSAGYAQNEEIHTLNAMQSQLLSEASDDMIKALRECTGSIRDTLNIQSACFSDDIEKRISGESESVLRQMKDKEAYISKYECFISNLNEAKNKTDEAGR